MKIKPIEDGNSVFEDVEIIKETPHCKNHGAMNKISHFDDTGGGYWRCISQVSKKSDNLCRTGCIQI